MCFLPKEKLSERDSEVFGFIEKEKTRQGDQIELIASENFTLPCILEAVGSVLTNKYAEGYPGRRYYGGCEYVDSIETLAIERAKKLFGAEHANVQAHSGTQANLAVYFAVLKPGDKILTMKLEHGGHLSHGHPKNASGMLYDVVNYGVDLSSGKIDYDEMAKLALQEKPKLITVGASAYAREIDFEKMGEVAKACGAMLLADIAHIAGLIAAGLHPSPVPYADFVTSTTHKTLRGPRGGLILCKKEFAKALDSSLFPGNQGGPLMHVIAGKAVCFKEAMTSEFKVYQQQVISNAKAMAEEFLKLGYNVVSGGTDNHLLLLDLRKTHPDLDGKTAQEKLEESGITVNRNTIPGETRSPFKASGLRIGTPAITTRGMKEKEIVQIVELIHACLSNLMSKEEINKQAINLCEKFPLPY